jgi:hypothetical protein
MMTARHLFNTLDYNWTLVTGRHKLISFYGGRLISVFA